MGKSQSKQLSTQSSSQSPALSYTGPSTLSTTWSTTRTTTRTTTQSTTPFSETYTQTSTKSFTRTSTRSRRPTRSSGYGGACRITHSHTSSIEWLKLGNKWMTYVPGGITSDVIQDILGDYGDSLARSEKRLFIQARCELAKEWEYLLKNATIRIYTDYRTYIIKAGDGTNILTIQNDGNGNIDMGWSGGVLRPVRDAVRGIGRFFTGILGPVASIASSSIKAISY